MTGTLLALVHRQPPAAGEQPHNQDLELRRRLDRARLHADQSISCYRWRGITVAALSHPLDPPGATEPAGPESGPGAGGFDPAIELSANHFGLMWGQLDPDGPGVRDAMARILARGPTAAATLSGNFVILLADQAAGTLLVIRDPLGSRGVFWTAGADGCWIATDERLLWPHSPQPEPAYLASFFAAQPPAADITPVAGVASLPPGHFMRAARGETPAAQRYWSFAFDPDVRRLGRAEQREALREHLRRAVSATTADGDCVAISGGLDSTAIAAVSGLTQAYTYRLNRWPESQEHRLAQETCDHLHMALGQIDCGAAEPLGHAFWHTPGPSCGPELDAYRAMRWRLADAARQQGHRGVLTGDFADQLYLGYPYALRDGFWRRPLGSLATAARRLRATPAFWRDPMLRRLGPLNGISRGRRRPRRPWLTAHCRSLLPAESRAHPIYGPLAQIDRMEGCLNSLTARAAHLGYLQGLRWGVEYRYPYRQEALVRFFLSLPADAWLDPHSGLGKPIMRRAMSSLLPASVTGRRDKTSLEPMFREAVLGSHVDQVHQALANRELWQPYVDQGWLRQRFERGDWTGFSLYVLWCCITASHWLQELTRGDSA